VFWISFSELFEIEVVMLNCSGAQEDGGEGCKSSSSWIGSSKSPSAPLKKIQIKTFSK